MKKLQQQPLVSATSTSGSSDIRYYSKHREEKHQIIIIKWFVLEKTLKSSQIQHPAVCSGLPRAPPTWPWVPSETGQPQLSERPEPHCPLSKEIPPNIQPKPLLSRFKTIPPGPITIQTLLGMYLTAFMKNLLKALFFLYQLWSTRLLIWDT